MKLADLRKHAISKQQKVHFRLQNGMDCVINEQGVAQVAQLNRVPDFNLEQELASATSFTLEPVGGIPKNGPKPRTVAREELAAMVTGTPAAAHHDEHEDE